MQTHASQNTGHPDSNINSDQVVQTAAESGKAPSAGAGDSVEGAPPAHVVDAAAAAIEKANRDSEKVTRKIREIFVKEGHNPRTRFDETVFQTFCGSVRAQGILQPILVRPLNGLYQVVAGERRYRAAKLVFGDDYDMPVLIREMTDAEAAAAAAAENIDRADMTPVEEARAASRQLGLAKNDRDEAANMMGWERSLFDRRLGLMNCSIEVQDALQEDKIKLGHAELLATLDKSKQDKLLPVIIAERKTVAELKDTINKAAARLADAKFDKADCVACPHNSAVQATLFTETITDGCCTNKACFQQKTTAWVNGIVEGLKDDYQVIRILNVGENETVTRIKADGPRGVGPEQAEACRGCANFGAAVSNLPQDTGAIFKNCCFDPACNNGKVATWLKSQIPESPKKDDAAQKATGSSKGSTGQGAGGKGKSDGKKDDSKAATTIVVGEPLKKYRTELWRKAMKREIARNAELSRRYLVGLSLDDQGRHISSSALKKVWAGLTKSDKQLSTGVSDCVGATLEATIEQVDAVIVTLAATMMQGIEVSKLQQLAKLHKLDLTTHWKLDADLLNLLTKNEIDLLAKEIGLDKAVGDGYKKLLTEKKPDLVKSLLGLADFNYSAKIPKILNY